MFKDELQTIRNMYNQYVNVTPQELYTKCVEEKLDAAMESYIKYLDREWAILYYNSDEGISEFPIFIGRKTESFGTVQKQARYNISDILHFKYDLERKKAELKEKKPKKEALVHNE